MLAGMTPPEAFAALDQMEALGLLVDGKIVGDWQMKIIDPAKDPNGLETLPVVTVLGQLDMTQVLCTAPACRRGLSARTGDPHPPRPVRTHPLHVR